MANSNSAYTFLDPNYGGDISELLKDEGDVNNRLNKLEVDMEDIKVQFQYLNDKLEKMFSAKQQSVKTGGSRKKRRARRKRRRRTRRKR